MYYRTERLKVGEHSLKSNHNNKAHYTHKCNLLELFQAMSSRKEAVEVCNRGTQALSITYPQLLSVCMKDNCWIMHLAVGRLWHSTLTVWCSHSRLLLTDSKTSFGDEASHAQHLCFLQQTPTASYKWGSLQPQMGLPLSLLLLLPPCSKTAESLTL